MARKKAAPETPEVQEPIVESVQETVAETAVASEQGVVTDKEEVIDADEEEAQEDAMYSGESGESEEGGLSAELIEELSKQANGITSGEEADTMAEGEVEQVTVATRQPVRARDDRFTLREAIANSREKSYQDTRFAEYDEGEERLLTDDECIIRETQLLNASRARRLVLEGYIVGTAFLGEARDETKSRNHEELAKRVIAIVKYGHAEITIPYKDFVSANTRRPETASINSYSAVIARPINTQACTKVNFVVTQIIRDNASDKPLYIGSRVEANRRQALLSYLGVRTGRGRVQPEIVNGMSYPARIINKTQSGLRCELRGLSFFLTNAQLTYSRREKVVQSIRDHKSKHLWVYVSNIALDKTTGWPTATFSGRNPHRTDVEAYIAKEGMQDATNELDEETVEVAASVKAMEAQVVGFHTNGVTCELTGYPGVTVSCRYSDDPRFKFLQHGDTVNLRVSKQYIMRDTTPFILGRIVRIASYNPTSITSRF